MRCEIHVAQSPTLGFNRRGLTSALANPWHRPPSIEFLQLNDQVPLAGADEATIARDPERVFDWSDLALKTLQVLPSDLDGGWLLWRDGQWYGRHIHPGRER